MCVALNNDIKIAYELPGRQGKMETTSLNVLLLEKGNVPALRCCKKDLGENGPKKTFLVDLGFKHFTRKKRKEEKIKQSAATTKKRS